MFKTTNKTFKVNMIRLQIMVILLITNCTIWGQEKYKGIIKGRVFNSKNNQPIEFASVSVWGTNIGVLSDIEGNFIFTGVQPGYVELRVSCVGFETYATSQMLVTNANQVFIEIPLFEKSQQIDAVVVTTSSFRRDEESPVSLRNIGIKEIEKNPGGNRDISRVLQSFPGVASTPSFRNDVIVRGGGSSENRFYLDGVEIPNLNHFSTQGASGGPVGIINIDFVREVNFYSGAFPADRGNALSSVLDFKQIDGNSEKLKTRISVGASDLAMTLDGPISKNTTFIVSARRSYLQFLFNILELPFLPTYNDFQFKTRTKINERNEITFIGLGAIDHSVLNLEANKTEEQRYILQYLPVNNQWNYTIGAVYRHYYEKSYDTWVVSRNMLNNQQSKYFNNLEVQSNKLLDYNSYESENKIRYEHNASNINGFKIIYGAIGEYAHYYNNTFRKNFGGEEIYKSNIDFIKYGLFGQLSKKVIDSKLTLSLGIRTDANNYDNEMSNLLNQISPRLSASYKLSNLWYLNFNMGRYYQLPPYTSLGFRNLDGNLVNKSNGITYISSNHFVTGVDLLPGQNSKLSVEGFFKLYNKYPFSVKDSIALASKGTDFGTYGDEEVISKGQGKAYGMEFLYQNKNFHGANITISYTLVRSEFKNSKDKYIPSAWDNKHLLNILVRKEFKGNWDIGLKWRFVGGSPYTPVDLDKSSLVEAWNIQGRAYLNYTKFNTLRLKSFHQLDLRIDKEFYFNKFSLIGYMDVQNVYNFKADQQPTYLIDERVPVIHDPERYTLKKVPRTGGGTVLPTIGIIVQF